MWPNRDVTYPGVALELADDGFPADPDDAAADVDDLVVQVEVGSAEFGQLFEAEHRGYCWSRGFATATGY